MVFLSFTHLKNLSLLLFTCIEPLVISTKYLVIGRLREVSLKLHFKSKSALYSGSSAGGFTPFNLLNFPGFSFLEFIFGIYFGGPWGSDLCENAKIPKGRIS